MSGVWERVMRSNPQILCALLKEQTHTDDSLSTLIEEVEFIVNLGLLSPIILDPTRKEPLTLNYFF